MLPGFCIMLLFFKPNRMLCCMHVRCLMQPLSQQIIKRETLAGEKCDYFTSEQIRSVLFCFYSFFIVCFSSEFVSLSSRMVKVSFSSALAQKDVKKDAENLIPEEDKDAEAVVSVRHQSRAWCWCMCLGLALMLSGVVVGGAYLYRFYIVEVSYHRQQGWDQEEGRYFVCGVNYREEDFMVLDEEEVEVDLPNQFHLRLLEERIRVLEEEQVELITVPVPEFGDGDPADIVHDFQRRLTAYLDLSLNKCYVIPLNTSIVMPPKDFLELLVNVKAGTYLPQSYLLHEEMIVTERLEHVDQLGYFIYNLCRGKDTFKLQRRDRILGMQKREAPNCHKIRHFENKFVVETMICEP